MECRPVPSDRIFIEELDAAYSDGAGAPCPLLDVFEVEEIVAKFLFGDQVGGFSIMLGQLLYGANIPVLGESAHSPQLKVLDHAFSKVSHGIPPFKDRQFKRHLIL